LHGHFDADMVHDLMVRYLEHPERITDPLHWARRCASLATIRTESRRVARWADLADVPEVAEPATQLSRVIALQYLERLPPDVHRLVRGNVTRLQRLRLRRRSQPVLTS
jgi:hypothetical protein